MVVYTHIDVTSEAIMTQDSKKNGIFSQPHLIFVGVIFFIAFLCGIYDCWLLANRYCISKHRSRKQEIASSIVLMPLEKMRSSSVSGNTTTVTNGNTPNVQTQSGGINHTSDEQISKPLPSINETNDYDGEDSNSLLAP